MPPAFIEPNPAQSESSASLGLSAPTAIPLNPAVSLSAAASLPLVAGASLSAYEGAALTIQPNSAAELHPHEWPPTVFDAVPMLATVAYVAVRENFRFYLPDHKTPIQKASRCRKPRPLD